MAYPRCAANRPGHETFDAVQVGPSVALRRLQLSTRFGASNQFGPSTPFSREGSALSGSPARKLSFLDLPSHLAPRRPPFYSSPRPPSNHTECQVAVTEAPAANPALDTMRSLLAETAGPERAMADAIRALAIDAVEAAKCGHPGMPMGMADVATVLWTRFLKFDAADPRWPDRDRFVLSAGHG